MPIPDYQTLMLPILEEVSDGHPRTIGELYAKLSDRFELSLEERNERVPSGSDTKMRNRVSWARTYLKKAGLVESPDRGMVVITSLGTKVLEEYQPTRIDNKYLRQFEGFVEFRPRKSDDSENFEAPIQVSEEIGTPEELMGEAFRDLRSRLTYEVLDAVKATTPQYFEQIVVDLLLAIGYGGNFKDAGTTTSYAQDEGIDGIINEDKLGLDTIYLQAKRWDNTVDRTEIDKFIGALTRKGARKGVFITTSSFSKGALAASNGLNISIVLIDGEELASLMIDHNVGVSTKDVFELKKLDADYFDENLA